MPALTLRHNRNDSAIQSAEQIVQNHIHLSMTIGSAPENAPNLKWPVKLEGGRKDIPVSFALPRRAVRGQLRVFDLKSSGIPVHLNDFEYIVKVRAQDGQTVDERLALLEAMHGQTVYLVDHFHPSNGLDHTDAIRSMFCQIGEIKSEHLALQFFWIPVHLTDNTL